MRELFIAGRRIADDTDPYTIAEVGHNHGGSLTTARTMIHAAATAGADAVKFQKRSNRELYTDQAYNAPYTSEHAYGPTYGEHREALEFSVDDLHSLQLTANLHGITLFATPFDLTSAIQLANLQVPCFKIASADIINIPLIRYVASFKRPVLLSTGGCTLSDVDRAVELLRGLSVDVGLLHCTAAYPCPAELLNLRVIATYRDRYPDLVCGLSSHFAHPYDTLVAYALGARIFEKHFSLDRASKGSDHAFSLEPDGFKGMVEHLKAARLMLGDGIKRLLPEEQGMIDKMRRTTRWYTEQGVRT